MILINAFKDMRSKMSWIIFNLHVELILHSFTSPKTQSYRILCLTSGKLKDGTMNSARGFCGRIRMSKFYKYEGGMLGRCVDNGVVAATDYDSATNDDSDSVGSQSGAYYLCNTNKHTTTKAHNTTPVAA